MAGPDDRQPRKPAVQKDDGKKEPASADELSLDESETTGIDPYNTARVPNPERHWRG